MRLPNIEHRTSDADVLHSDRGAWGNIALLVVCMVGAGLVSLALGKDTSWDLQNHHYYIPYAFLYDRLQWDIAPAQLQTYINPLLDLPFYFLVETVREPRAVAFVMGGLHGVAVFFLAKLVWLALKPHPASTRILCTPAALLVGLTGAAALPLLGATSNDWYIAAFVLASLYVLLYNTLREGNEHLRRAALLAGLLCGAAVGLKLTAAIYAIGIAVALLFHGRSWRESFMLVGAYGIAGLFGLLLTGGFWMWQLQELYGSPVFPFFNDVFRSEYWEASRFADDRFTPQSLLQWLFYPFFWLSENRYVTEPPMRDTRLALIMVLAGLLMARRAWSGVHVSAADRTGDGSGATGRLLLVFFGASYVVWLVQFSIYRYAATLDLLSGLILVMLAIWLFGRGRYGLTAVFVLSLVVVVSTQYPNWGRSEFGEQFIDTRAPELPPRALVLMGGSEPVSYLIPLARRDARFVAVANNMMQPGQSDRMVEEARRIVREHDGPLLALYPRQAEAAAAAVLDSFGLALAKEACQDVRLMSGSGRMRLCHVRR